MLLHKAISNRGAMNLCLVWQLFTTIKIIPMHLDNILYRAMPVLAIFLLAELIFLVREHRHDHKDMLASFALALGTIPLSMVTTGIIIYFYSWIYQFRIFNISFNQWWGWLIIFIADDLTYYWYHRMSHKIRFLWASHSVHHSSEKFTMSSGMRVPWTSNLTGTFLFWAWMPLIGIEPAMVVAMKTASVIYQFWVHTETINKMPKWFEAVFNTPSHHRVHHSSDLEYLDKNHAGTLIIWDKLFGTYQEEIFKPKYGLTSNIRSYNPIVIAFHEWKNIFRDMRSAGKLKYKLNYLLRSPGWSHTGTHKTVKQIQSHHRDKKNYRLPVSNPLNKYVAVLFCCLLIFNSHAQERKLIYDITRNGSVIGNINYIELIQGQKKFLSFSSSVKTRFIFAFTDESSETAAFDNGLMVYSSFYQKQNGSLKANKKTVASGRCYRLMDKDILKHTTCDPIRFNTLLLFINKPESITKVYSDNFQKHLELKKIDDNKYRLTMPDGNYNFYTYKGGVCHKVDIERTLFTIHFELKQTIHQ